jgi:hypothetical protein
MCSVFVVAALWATRLLASDARRPASWPAWATALEDLSR